MKVIKLDRRYRGFPKWKYAVQFHVKPKWGYGNPYYGYCRLFEELHGPEFRSNPKWNSEKIWSENRWIHNEHWKTDYDLKRIYYNNPADLSMIMLKLGVDQ